MRETFGKRHSKWQFETADVDPAKTIGIGNPHISQSNFSKGKDNLWNRGKPALAEGPATPSSHSHKIKGVTIAMITGPAFHAAKNKEGKPATVSMESYPRGYKLETQEKLTQAQRDALPASAFADPAHRRFPMPDKSHARFAVAMMKHAGSAKVKKKIVGKAEAKGVDVSKGSNEGKKG